MLVCPVSRLFICPSFSFRWSSFLCTGWFGSNVREEVKSCFVISSFFFFFFFFFLKKKKKGKAESIGDVFLMLIGSVLFTHGHGVHLAANSLSNTCHAEAGIKSLCAGSPQLEQ
jgi:hypothetical protein